MRIDIITVLPEMVSAALDHSIIKRAMDRGLIDIRVVNLRDYAFDRHRTTDDVPYGGGGGMVMKLEPIALALCDLLSENEKFSSQGSEGETQHGACTSKHLTVQTDDSDWIETLEKFKANRTRKSPRIALTDPRGAVFTQETAKLWAKEERLILICGRYEGVDERVRQFLATDEVSIGDYVLTGGELPALIIADALTRLQDGALGDAEAPDKDTFAGYLLEYPHYTRPQSLYGLEVPEILFSGHHARIETWRRWHQLTATRERRPDLFAKVALSALDSKLLSGTEPVAPPDPKAIRRAAALAAEPKKEEAPSTGENLRIDHEKGLH